MNKKEYTKFEAMMELIPPKKTQAAAMAHESKNWFLLHPKLALLEPNEFSFHIAQVDGVQLTVDEPDISHTAPREKNPGKPTLSHLHPRHHSALQIRTREVAPLDDCVHETRADQRGTHK